MDKFVLQLEGQLADRSVTIELSPESRAWLGRQGYDPLYGARPLARVIQEQIKKTLAEELLFGKLQKGGVVTVGLDAAEGKLTFLYEESQRAKHAAGKGEREEEMVER